MTPTPYAAEFTYRGMPVGLFLGSNPPANDGVFAYEPYRGLGHLEMWKEIEANGFAECVYELNGTTRSFEVRDLGEYGKLALSNFVK
jgi:hypothetical protein